MFADIYRTRKTNTFLLVPRGAGTDAVPDFLLADLGPSVFLSTREIGTPNLRSDAADIDGELTRQGYSVRTA